MIIMSKITTRLLHNKINSFFVGFTWLLDISKSIPLSRIRLERPREKKNVNETKQEKTEQTRGKRPVGFNTRCYFGVEIFQIQKF